jgi:hypothetical protein
MRSLKSPASAGPSFFARYEFRRLQMVCYRGGRGWRGATALHGWELIERTSVYSPSLSQRAMFEVISGSDAYRRCFIPWRRGSPS